ncbi:TetR family transcriptional regulator C-terminal domain-containing protein [Embleya sp. NPDC020630]|uniref:TetR family transcriptional regulator C-terminal domain-containing protein n=1 Tax=Embleya sp. NPDC020630 TaxID=3363979 RepID=UPI0037B1D572
MWRRVPPLCITAWGRVTNARAYTEESKPRGCMIVLSATNCSKANAPVREHVASVRREGIDDLTRRLCQGVRDGDVPPGVDAAGVASFYGAVIQGMSVQARDGASRADLERVAAYAMAAWDAVVGDTMCPGSADLGTC